MKINIGILFQSKITFQNKISCRTVHRLFEIGRLGSEIYIIEKYKKYMNFKNLFQDKNIMLEQFICNAQPITVGMFIQKPVVHPSLYRPFLVPCMN